MFSIKMCFFQGCILVVVQPSFLLAVVDKQSSADKVIQFFRNALPYAEFFESCFLVILWNNLDNRWLAYSASLLN